MNKLYPIFILLCFSVFLTSCILPYIQSEFGQKTTEQPQKRTTEQLQKSVVRIRSNKRQGTGFVIGVSENKAYIITVSHVVDNKNPSVEFFADKKLTAEVLDREPQENGLTLLLVEGQIPYEAIPLYLVKQRELNKGDTMFTFGFPRGGAPWTYDELTYSGQKRRILQFSTSGIEEGNSGCPVIKGDQIVAMITSITNYAFAIPAESIREFLRGTKAGKRILNEMEKWDSIRWHKEYEIRLAKARQQIASMGNLAHLQKKPILPTAQHALVVGINQYSHRKLGGAVNDALIIRDALRNIKVQLPNERVLLNNQATYSAFIRAWQNMLEQAKPGDTLILTFSGLGIQKPDTAPLDERDNQDEALLLFQYHFDAELEELYKEIDAILPNSNLWEQFVQDYITDDELEELFKEAKDYNILFIVDACNSGGIISSVVPNTHKNHELSHVTIITAVEFENLSAIEISINGKPHGALSWFFTQAITGKADGNQDGYLERRELKHFLVENVSIQMKNIQKPKLWPRGDSKIVLTLGNIRETVESSSCVHYEPQINQAIQSHDLDRLENLLPTVETKTDCSITYLDNMKRRMAQIVAIKAKELTQQSQLSKAEVWLKRAPVNSWEIQEAYGNIAAHRKLWQMAAQFYYQALNLMTNPTATPQAPSKAQIAKIHKLARETKLLADISVK